MGKNQEHTTTGAVGTTVTPSIPHPSPVGKRMDTFATLLYNRFEMVKRSDQAWDLFMGAINAVSSIPLERLGASRRRSGEESSSPSSANNQRSEPTTPAGTIERVNTAGTEETIAWQRRQIAKELYTLQKNLAANGLINGKSCDCIAGKHALGLEALAEETMAMHHDPVYQEMVDWAKELDAKGTPEAIVSGQYTDDYQRMTLEARAFRKRLMGTTDTAAMMTEQEREEVLNRAKNVAREQVDMLVEKELEVVGGNDGSD